MTKIAITGNIASGKSEVQKILQKKGYKVLDTDIVGHNILQTNNDIKSAFSDYDVFNSDKTISREKLAKLVFSDKKLKGKLESISHPIIRKNITEFFEQNSSERLIFVGIPLVFEANMQDMFDKIILVYTDDEIRKKRLIKRNNYSLEQAQIRMDCQMPQEEKKYLCDYIIQNNSDITDLEQSVAALIGTL